MGVSRGAAQPSKPRVFVGSSSESEIYAVATKRILEDHGTLSVTYWKDLPGAAGSQTIIEILTDAAEEQFDFAVFVLSQDDAVTFRGKSSNVPRDNVIFEMGLFIGTLGRENVFLIAPNKPDLKLPSDIGGVKTGAWTEDSNADSAVRSAASAFRSLMEGRWSGGAIIPGRMGSRPAGSRTAESGDVEFWLKAYNAGALEELNPVSVEIGDEIVHPRWGPGVVTEVHPGSTGSRYLTIEFPRGTATLLSDKIALQKFIPHD